MDLNSVTLTGRLGSQPELRYTPRGTAIVEINIANDRGTAENPRLTWIGMKIWGKTAEAFARYLAKGSKIAVHGELTQDEWTDKTTGKPRRKTHVTVRDWTFADSKKTDTPSAAATQDDNPSQRQADTIARDLGT